MKTKKDIHNELFLTAGIIDAVCLVVAKEVNSAAHHTISKRSTLLLKRQL